MLITAKQNRTYWQRFEMGVKQISRSFDLARNTVRRYVRFFQECGIPIKDLAAMPSARIQEMFSERVDRNRVPSHRQLKLEALLPEYRKTGPKDIQKLDIQTIARGHERFFGILPTSIISTCCHWPKQKQMNVCSYIKACQITANSRLTIGIWKE